MIMKRSELRKVIREIIERELNNQLFPIRRNEFDEEDETDFVEEMDKFWVTKWLDR